MSRWKWSGVPGRDLHDCLEWACKELWPQSYLEIGVDGGGSLGTVLKACQSLKYVPGSITLCDLWTGHAGHDFKDFDHIIPILEQYGAKATFLSGDSANTVPQIGEKFDLILVDGDHSLAGALLDLNNCWPLLNRGGIMVVDDVGHHAYHGVREAFDRFGASHQEAELIQEEGAPIRNCAVISKP